jgi:ABC-type lipoprotein export system ATPase subunit
MSLLSLKHVVKRTADGRGQIAVLDDVSLDIEVGDFVGVWGIRRSGKTTLLKVAAGIELPDEGSVFFDGQDMTAASADRRAEMRRRGGVGLLVSEWRPERNHEAIDHVAVPLLSEGMSLREAKQPAWRALERAGASQHGSTPVDRLSHAERIRIALARLLVREPRLLLVDEPVFSRPSESVELYELLRSLRRDTGLAIVIASEDVAPIRKAHRVMSIGDGRLRPANEPSGTLVTFPKRAER